MKYISLIDNKKSSEWGLSLPEAYLFSWLWDVPSWAENLIIGTDIYYFSSRFKAIDDMPMLTNKPDTIYRYFKSLESKGLIEMKKIDGKDYMRLTQKSKTWNQEIVGNKSEHSEMNPNELGNKSENNSDLNPTDYTISKDYTISDNGFEKFDNFSENPQQDLFGTTEPKDKKERKKKEKTAHQAYMPIVKFFCEEYWPDYKFFGARDGKCVNEIIAQIERMLNNHNQDSSPEKVVDFFKALILKAPTFYQKKGLPTINSKLSEIVEEIKKQRNGQSTSKTRNEYLYADF